MDGIKLNEAVEKNQQGYQTVQRTIKKLPDRPTQCQSINMDRETQQ